MDKNEVSLEELTERIKLGSEIEFHTQERQYFIQPNYDVGGDNFCLYDCITEEHLELICCGSVDQILQFSFPNGCTLAHDFNEFYIDYIL